MSLYRMKLKLLSPYTAYMRRKERHLPEESRDYLETHHYSPAYYRFIASQMEHPGQLYEGPIDESSVALDVGAYVGEWAEEIRKRYGARVYAFEPNPECHADLEKRLGHDAKVTCFDYGLFSKDTTLVLEQKAMGSTLFEDGLGAGHGRVSVRLRDVVKVLDELSLDEVGLLKINIEGAEYELLDRLIDSGYIRRIRCLMVQFHEWRDGAYFRRWRIHRGLRRTHVCDWNHPFIWEKWTRRS